ncbi:MAG: 50S ribosomal protein L6 [Ignavibacteriae bacterium]|nr:MAG: 50S ribosomal protein L6 [Ignavibacteriota bacterium]
MSRVGKKPVVIPDGVKITQEGNFLKIKGPKGELERQIHPNIGIEIVENQVNVTRPDDTKQNKSLHGLSRALVQNMVTGVTDTYKKTLDIVGVGYKAELKGKNLLLNIGYSHPIFLIPPEGITLEIPTQTQIIVSGIDKQLVGLIAAKIRSFRKPEPYKGKGIKYSDEHIVRKAGKTAG